MKILEKDFSWTTITNKVQILEDDEVEDQNNLKENQDTSKDEETMLDNAPHIQGSRLFDSMDFNVGEKMQDDGMDYFVMQEG